jgi:rubrerythrin
MSRFESAEATPWSRRRFLERLVAVTGGVLVAGTVVRLPRASSAPSASREASVLNFLLLLESMQAQFYGEALGKGALTGELRRFAEVVAQDERRHVDFLERALADAREEPSSVAFSDATGSEQAFVDAAIALEESAIATYIGQGANLTGRYVTDAARITSVEARHAAWIRAIAGRNPAPRGQDVAKTAREVTTKLSELGFLPGTPG